MNFLIREVHNSNCGGFLGYDDFLTPLWYAVGNGELEVVKLLIELGADINAVSRSEISWVNYACIYRQTDTVKLLVKQGADIHRPDKCGYTCLMNSFYCLELCQFLIDSGAVVNAQDIFGDTALHHAIMKDRLEIVQLLLDNGSDQNIKNKVGDDAFRCASLRGKEMIVMELVSRKKPAPSRWIESLQLLGCYFFFSTAADNISQALSFWKKSVTFRKMNPGAELAENKSVGICTISKVIKSPEELEDLCQDQEMVHMYAFENLLRIVGPTHEMTLKELSIFCKICAKNGKYRRSFNLLKYELHILQECKLTKEYSRVLEMLYSTCSDAFRESNFQIEIRDLLQVFDMVISKMQFVKKSECNNISYPMHDILQFINLISKLDKCPDQMVSFKQAIHRLVRSQIRDCNGRTLLHHAAMYCKTFPGVAEVLLESGADVNALDSKHNTALHFCTGSFSDPGSVLKGKVIELLLQYSAHPDILNDEGHFAATGLSLNKLDHVNLKCLATAVIRDRRIPYVGQIPESLQSFVEMHGKCR